MKQLLLLTITSLTIATAAQAQFSEFQNNIGAPSFTLSSENNTLEIGGRVSFYYENRALKSGITDKSHNGFDIKDADLDFLGKTSSKFVYEFHISLADLTLASATLNTANPANPGIKAAYIGYNKFIVHIKFGYDKLPYSQGSLNEVYGTPMWSHANLYGGDLFSRRDLGITLNSTFWKSHINLYAGAYSGMGENFFEYGNDASGTLEYVGRAEFQYPAKMKYHSIDEENSPVPQFRLGVNARYTDKTQPAGQNILGSYPDAPGAYGLRVINGKRTLYGGDFIVKYKGISALFETDMMKLQPSSNSDALYEGTASFFNDGYVKAGGYVAGLNYNWENIHSVFSVQYENFDANDLVKGHQEWFYAGYAYKVNGFNSVFKIEYYKPLTEDVALNPLKYTSQIRVGYQIVF